MLPTKESFMNELKGAQPKSPTPEVAVLFDNMNNAMSELEDQVNAFISELTPVLAACPPTCGENLAAAAADGRCQVSALQASLLRRMHALAAVIRETRERVCV